MAAGRSKTAEECPKTAEDGLRTAQETFKTAQDGLRWPKRASKMGSTTDQECLRIAQEAYKTALKRPNFLTPGRFFKQPIIPKRPRDAKKMKRTQIPSDINQGLGKTS